MQSSISGLKPYASPLQLMLKSFGIDTLSGDEIAFELRGWLNDWEDIRRSPRSDWRVCSSAAWRGFARIVKLQLINNGYDNGTNIIA